MEPWGTVRIPAGKIGGRLGNIRETTPLGPPLNNPIMKPTDSGGVSPTFPKKTHHLSEAQKSATEWVARRTEPPKQQIQISNQSPTVEKPWSFFF